MDLSKSRRYIELSTPTASLPTRLTLEGIKYDQSGVRFDSAIYSVNQAAVLSAAMLGEPASITLRESNGNKRKKFKPGKSHLEAINKHTTEERELDDFYVYQRVPVNNIPSRTLGLRFTEKIWRRLRNQDRW